MTGDDREVAVREAEQDKTAWTLVKEGAIQSLVGATFGVLVIATGWYGVAREERLLNAQTRKRVEKIEVHLEAREKAITDFYRDPEKWPIVVKNVAEISRLAAAVEKLEAKAEANRDLLTRILQRVK